MNHLRIVLASLTLTVSLLAPTTASALTQTQQIAALKKQNAALALKVKAQAKTIVTLKAQLATARTALNAANATLATTTATLGTRTTERDNALAGLPAAISAVPADQWATLVFAPARAAASRVGCGDSFYSSDGYTSYTFNLGKFCTA